MPEVAENIDKSKHKEICRRAIEAAQIWLELYVAVAKGDIDDAKAMWPKLRTVSVEASDFLKGLGQ